MPADSLADVAQRLAALGFRRLPGAPAVFTVDGRAVRIGRRAGGWSGEARVLGGHWVDAAVVAAAIDGQVAKEPDRSLAAACDAVVGAARLPAFARSTRRLHHLRQAEVYWWGPMNTLVLEVIFNYFDMRLYEINRDSIEADRDAQWEFDLTPEQATALVHALWLATGGELARDPVRLGPVTLLPMFGDRCELRVLETDEHRKLLGNPLFLDLDLLVALHTTLRYLPGLCG